MLAIHPTALTADRRPVSVGCTMIGWLGDRSGWVSFLIGLLRWLSLVLVSFFFLYVFTYYASFEVDHSFILFFLALVISFFSLFFVLQNLAVKISLAWIRVL